MEMRAREEVEMGEDITEAISPLVTALYDSSLRSHCSFCFSPLPVIPTFSTTSSHVLHCSSPRCSSLLSSSPAAAAAAESLLLQSIRSFASHPLTSSDLLAALRLLRILFLSPADHGRLRQHHRVAGLLTNRREFLSRADEDEPLSHERIREGAKLVAAAWRGERMESGAGAAQDDGVFLEEEEAEAALCSVLTNAVEVQDEESGRGLGIAVYDWRFSWINHSCSPNACYRFSFSSSSSASSSLSPHQETTSFCAKNNSGIQKIVPHSSSVQVNLQIIYAHLVIIQNVRTICVVCHVEYCWLEHKHNTV